jgi:hypothetical protein
MLLHRQKGDNTMSIMKPSAIATSLAVGVAAVVGVTSVAVSQVAKPQTVQQGPEAVPADRAPAGKGPVAERDGNRAPSSRDMHVDAPRTRVNVSRDTGKVRVKAPYTNVKVDPDRGQVRVRAPYVDLNIRW